MVIEAINHTILPIIYAHCTECLVVYSGCRISCRRFVIMLERVCRVSVCNIFLLAESHTNTGILAVDRGIVVYHCYVILMINKCLFHLFPSPTFHINCFTSCNKCIIPVTSGTIEDSMSSEIGENSQKDFSCLSCRE